MVIQGNMAHKVGKSMSSHLGLEDSSCIEGHSGMGYKPGKEGQPAGDGRPQKDTVSNLVVTGHSGTVGGFGVAEGPQVNGYTAVGEGSWVLGYMGVVGVPLVESS